jgi:hypothetical protein
VVDEENEVDAAFELANQRFSDATATGDPYYFVQTWPAWMLDTKNKTVVPIDRVYIGNTSGNLVFDRPVLYTGVIDLIDELAGIAARTTKNLKGLEGYVIDLPFSRRYILERIQTIKDLVVQIENDLNELQFEHADENVDDGNI